MSRSLIFHQATEGPGKEQINDVFARCPDSDAVGLIRENLIRPLLAAIQEKSG